MIERLRRRADFLLAAAKGCSRAQGALVVQARDRADGQALVRIGFTATRRVGGAVIRNRAKRRLRAAARIVAPLHARAGCDYVFIARGGTVSRGFLLLLDDMTRALARLDGELVRQEPASAPQTPSSDAVDTAAPPSPGTR